jgi:hypothetical protein
VLSKLSIRVLRKWFKRLTSSYKGVSRFNYLGISTKETLSLFLILVVAYLILSLIRL